MAAPLKRCLVRRRDGREQHGLAASCLRELRHKGEGRPPGHRGVRRAAVCGRGRQRLCRCEASLRAVEQRAGPRVSVPNGEGEGRWEYAPGIIRVSLKCAFSYIHVKVCVNNIDFWRGNSRACATIELICRASGILAIDEAKEPITLVLAEDGTIVDDEDYFLCLPSDTKFVALAKNEKWPGKSLDSGTAGLSEAGDEVDSGAERWKQLARKLKDDLSNIILMSEEDLQVLIDVPRSDLAGELAQSQTQTQVLQDTLQQVLDRREEERQSRQLLELYLEALKNEDSILSKVTESEAVQRKERDVVDAGISSTGTSAKTALGDQILAALKEKPAPELCLDSQDLELVVKEDTGALASALGWDKQKAEALQQACDQELSKRLQQVQTLHSLRSMSKGKKTLPLEDWLSSKRKK